MSVDAVMCTLESVTADTLTLHAPRDLHSPGPGIAHNVRAWARFNGYQFKRYVEYLTLRKDKVICSCCHSSYDRDAAS